MSDANNADADEPVEPTYNDATDGDGGLTLDDLPQPVEETTVHPDDLDVDGENPNEQPDEMFGLLCDNMRKRGWVGNDIIAAHDTHLIADGEHRWRAAKEIGLTEVPVKFYDLTDEERRLYRQELNKISGTHDPKRDALEYDLLLDNGMSDEVQALTDASGEDIDELLDLIKVDRNKRPGYTYDHDHNVHFEDCVEGMRDRLPDDTIDCVVTDPPYGIDYDGKQEGRVEGDEDADDALALLDDVAAELRRVLRDDGHAYIFWTAQDIPGAHEVLDRHFTIANVAVWVKNKANILVSQNGAKYAYSYEPIFFVTLGDDSRPLNGKPTDLKDVFDYAKVEDINHPTEKPVPLLSDLITNSTDKDDVVLDPFMGSGSTAVAAIQNERECIGFEIAEAEYRSVVERRIDEAKRQMMSPQNAPGDTTS